MPSVTAVTARLGPTKKLIQEVHTRSLVLLSGRSPNRPNSLLSHLTISSALAALGSLQPKAFVCLNPVDPSVSVSNYYLLFRMCMAGLCMHFLSRASCEHFDLELAAAFRSQVPMTLRQYFRPRDGLGFLSSRRD